MKPTESQSLLAEYAQTGSEAAFRELVNSYIALVYSTALRRVGQDAHLAQDVAQTVFADLARKAARLPANVMLGGWLHHHTVFVASNLLRRERRRQARERQAVAMNALPDHNRENLAQLAPLLDEAIDQLGAEDRSAIVLRFFEQRDFPTIGELLGSTEEAARKRVGRALEKLQRLLKRRGVSLSLAALGSALAAEAVTAAPAGLAASVGGAALAATAAGGMGLTLFNSIAMTKLKVGVLTAVVVGGVVVPLALQHRALVQARQENQALRHQLEPLARLEAQNARLAQLVAQARPEPESSPGASAELLRLRGEVGVLRRQLQEAQQAGNASTTGNSTSPGGLSPSEASLESQMRAEGRHWVLTHGNINVGSLVQDNVLGRPDLPAGAGTLGRVVSLGSDASGRPTAVVDLGRGFTWTYRLDDITAVSDVAAPDSAEGTVRAQGQQWVPARGAIASGDWVEDMLDGRRDQPEGRGALGKVVSVSNEDGSPPAAMVDFGRGYTVGIKLSELSRVSVSPR